MWKEWLETSVKWRSGLKKANLERQDLETFPTRKIKVKAGLRRVLGDVLMNKPGDEGFEPHSKATESRCNGCVQKST